MDTICYFSTEVVMFVAKSFHITNKSFFPSFRSLTFSSLSYKDGPIILHHTTATKLNDVYPKSASTLFSSFGLKQPHSPAKNFIIGLNTFICFRFLHSFNSEKVFSGGVGTLRCPSLHSGHFGSEKSADLNSIPPHWQRKAHNHGLEPLSKRGFIRLHMIYSAHYHYIIAQKILLHEILIHWRNP